MSWRTTVCLILDGTLQKINKILKIIKKGLKEKKKWKKSSKNKQKNYKYKQRTSFPQNWKSMIGKRRNQRSFPNLEIWIWTIKVRLVSEMPKKHMKQQYKFKENLMRKGGLSLIKPSSKRSILSLMFLQK